MRQSETCKAKVTAASEFGISVGEPKIFGWTYSLEEGALKALGHQGKGCQSYGNMDAYRDPRGGKKGI